MTLVPLAKELGHFLAFCRHCPWSSSSQPSAPGCMCLIVPRFNEAMDSGGPGRSSNSTEDDGLLEENVSAHSSLVHALGNSSSCHLGLDRQMKSGH